MQNKTKTSILIITIGLIFLISSVGKNVLIDKHRINNQPSETEDDYALNVPTISNYWDNFTFIHIRDNWSIAASYEWCRGDGTWGNPYIIENITMDASSSPTKSGIFIENSKNDYFIIRNCTVSNIPIVAGAAGIKLKNVNNGTIIKNYCFGSWGSYGIYLLGTSSERCENNSIVENIVRDFYNGIYLYDYCDYNNISGNTANHNYFGGIVLHNSYYNNITGNTANANTIQGLYLYDCNYNIVDKNICNNNRIGIYAQTSDFNNFTYNKANYNSYGIFFHVCENNRILYNQFLEDDYPITEYECQGNIFEGNIATTPEDDDDDDKKKGKEEAIPGYDIAVIIAFLSTISLILLKKEKKKIF